MNKFFSVGFNMDFVWAEKIKSPPSSTYRDSP